MAEIISRLAQRRLLARVSMGASGLALVLVVVLAYLYVVALPRHASPQAHLTLSSPTPTTSMVVPMLPPDTLLSWQTVAFPSGFASPNNMTSLAVAPSDADTAYACTLTSQPHAIWATHDRGRIWGIVGHLPTSHAGSCDLVVDATQPETLVVTSASNPTIGTSGANPLAVVATDFASFDGGQHWTQRPALNITTKQSIFRKSDGKLLNYTPISELYLIAIASDGTLIAAVDDASMATTSMPPGIYRLSPGTSEWQRIGRAPSTARAYLATFMPFTSGAFWLGGECASLVPSEPCYTVNAGDGAYTASYT